MTVAHRLILRAIRDGKRTKPQIEKHIAHSVGRDKVNLVDLPHLVAPLVEAGLVRALRHGRYEAVR
jgi:hypothetical protein